MLVDRITLQNAMNLNSPKDSECFLLNIIIMEMPPVNSKVKMNFRASLLFVSSG